MKNEKMAALLIPIKTVSTLNQREHWAKRARRARSERMLASMVTPRRLDLPLTVSLTRIAPRALDGHDNLSSSFKAIVDGICDRLEIDDRDPRITFRYSQERGKPKEYAVRIEIG